jgi:hypothetical protein
VPEGSENVATGSAEGQDPIVGTGDAGQQAEDKGQDPQSKPEPKTYDESYVRKIRDEAAAARVELKELRAELKQLKEGPLSESDKLALKIKELEDDNRNLIWKQREANIIAQAAALGCKKPQLMVRLIDDDVEDEDLSKALNKLKRDNPELFLNQIGTADGGSGMSGAGSGAGRRVEEDMNFLIRSAAGR